MLWWGNGAESAYTHLLALALEMWNHLRSTRAKPAAAACMRRKLICICWSRAMFPAVTKRSLDAMDGTEMLQASTATISSTTCRHAADQECLAVPYWCFHSTERLPESSCIIWLHRKIAYLYHKATCNP